MSFSKPKVAAKAPKPKAKTKAKAAPAARATAAKVPVVRVAIIGTGGMANNHAEHYVKIAGVQLVAAMDIDLGRAEAFAAKHKIPQVFTDVKKLLAESGCDAVSIVTPDGTHAPLSIQALKAGKHVLCEKPLALNHADTKRMVAAAEKSGKINMVNLSYRNWSAIQGAAEAINRGAIGEIRHVEASYLQSWLPSKIWGDWRTTAGWLWRLSTKHGSKGVLGDVGVHIVDFATFPAGSIRNVYCKLKTFDKAPGNKVGEYDLDANDSAVMTVEFANGALGTIHTTRWSSGHANRLYLKISGTHGAVEIDSDRSNTTYKICTGPDLDKALWREVEVKPVPSIYQRYITAIQTGVPGSPDFKRGSEVQKVLDACIESDAKGLPVKV